MKPLIAVCISCCLMLSCVTVELSPKKGERSSEVQFQQPSSPFQSSSTETSDHLWLSSRTGNSISFLSECKGSEDLNLEQLESDALGALDNVHVLESKKFEYNNREASSTLAEGQVDGVPIKMKVISLKKNNCNYTLVYAAVAKNFAQEIESFESFVRGFKAP